MSEDKKTLLILTMETANRIQEQELLNFLRTYQGFIFEVQYTGVAHG